MASGVRAARLTGVAFASNAKSGSGRGRSPVLLADTLRGEEAPLRLGNLDDTV